MATVMDHVAASVFGLLEQVPCRDEASYNQLLQMVCGLMIFDLDWYVTAHAPLPAEVARQLRGLLLRRPFPQAGVQAFFDCYVPAAEQERLTAAGVRALEADWRRRLGLPPQHA